MPTIFEKKQDQIDKKNYFQTISDYFQTFFKKNYLTTRQDVETNFINA